MRKMIHVLTLALAATLLQPSLAMAQAYPNKPIRFLVPTQAGSAPDVATRRVAAQLSDILKQPVVVENRPGANGVLAAREVARSLPDGYTMLNANIGNAINDLLRPEPGSRLTEELVAVSDLTTAALILVVHPSVPASNLKELVELARKQPGKLTYASGGPGSLTQLAGERLKQAAKVDIREIPYKSLGADAVDLLAGRVDIGYRVWSSVAQSLANGSLKAIAVASSNKLLAAPQIPTTAEAGFPDQEALGWNGMFVPAGTPPAVIQTMQKAIAEAISRPVLRDVYVRDGTEIGGKTPEQFTALIKADKLRYAKIIKDADIKLLD